MSHKYTSEISAVKDWLSRVPMPQRIAHRAIMLIIRLDAEIERLYKSLALTAKEQYTNGRTDGVKEFAERLKPLLFNYYDSDIDGLVKEMTGEQK